MKKNTKKLLLPMALIFALSSLSLSSLSLADTSEALSPVADTVESGSASDTDDDYKLPDIPHNAMPAMFGDGTAWCDYTYTSFAGAPGNGGVCYNFILYRVNNDVTRVTWKNNIPQIDVKDNTNVDGKYEYWKSSVGYGVMSYWDGAFANCTNLEVFDSGYRQALQNIPGIWSIGEKTFLNCVNLRTVILSDEVDYIADDAFEGCDKDKLVIYCPEGSYAEQYARENGFKYKTMKMAYNTSEGMDIEKDIFNKYTYLENNPDIVAQYRYDVNDIKNLYDHWLEYGIKEGRKGSDIFDVKYYIEHNPEVKAKYDGDYYGAYLHYITEGYYYGLPTIAPSSEPSTENVTSAPGTENSTEAATTAKHSGGGGGGGGSSVSKTTTTTTAVTTETETPTKPTTQQREETTEATTAAPLEIRVSIGSSTASIGNESYALDTAPYIQASSNSTLVPLRFVAVALGGMEMGNIDTSKNILWDNASKTATVIAGNKTVKFTAGSNIMLANDSEIPMPNGAAAEINNGRMFVPFRALGDALGVQTDWENDTKTAVYKMK